jgi:protein TonB
VTRVPAARWPWLLSLALHGAALGALVLALGPRVAQEPAPPPGVEIVWEADSPETVGGAPEPEAPGELPSPPEPPAAEAPPPPLVAAEPAQDARPEPDLPPPPPPTPPVPTRRAASPREGAAPGPLAAAQPGLGRALGAVVPPAPDERFRNAAPAYPEQARARGEQGVVALELVIGTDGRVIAVQVLRSSGSPILDGAARRAALDWRFRPATQDGQPVPAQARTTVQFRLE